MSTLASRVLILLCSRPSRFRETVGLHSWLAKRSGMQAAKYWHKCFGLALPGLRVLGYGEILPIAFPTPSLCLGVFGIHWALFLVFATCFEIAFIIFPEFFLG